MGDSFFRPAFGAFLYGLVFFLMITFILLHLSWPIKVVGNLIKVNKELHRDSATESLAENFPQYLGGWGAVTFLDGALLVVAIIIILFVRQTLS